MSENSTPLVSIICFCRNRVSTMRRSIESVVGQNYSNIEFVVQDGASTDGTLEMLREYESRDGRIKLVSAPDSGPAEAFWKVLHRCKGDIIGTCLSDEELLPGVVQSAVRRFQDEPRLGAITCDGYYSDETGTITGDFKAGEFDFVAYLFDRYCPFWPGSFFRRSALIDVGLLDSDWNMDCIEFEVWCRLATDHEVKYIPEPVSKYAVHPTQASNTPANFNEHIGGRLQLVEKMFSSEGFFGPNEFMKLDCMINQVGLFHNHARAYRLQAEERKFAAQIGELEARRGRRDALSNPFGFHAVATDDAAVAERVADLVRFIQRILPASLRRAVPPRLKALGARYIVISCTMLASGRLPANELRDAEARLQYRWAKLAASTSSRVRRLLPRWMKDAARRVLVRTFAVIRFLPIYVLWIIWRLRSRGTERANQDQIQAADPSRPLLVYPQVALLYDARGQIRQALDMWQRAEGLNDPMIDGLACQAILKLPSASYSDIAALQQKWADKHAQPLASRAGFRFTPHDKKRRLRIGYHCSFMESDTIRFIMRNVIAAHDRTHFEIYGYSPVGLSDDINSAFDVVRDTAFLAAPAFIDKVRNDGIDVFIELSGLSPGHRYVEMASRCAPVQVSYLNHHGTSRIPAVDWFLSDDISTPPGSGAEDTFTEKIHRLPDCLLCYDYEGYPHPPVADPPSRKKGSITFGCFGSGSKINSELIEWWAALLHRVPGSTLYLRNPQLTSADNQRYMQHRFRWFGIEADRLRFGIGTDRTSLVKCYDEVDISLDTWPYCGGNTIAESLWQGVPVVTLKGSRISSRYGSSLVNAAGCPELVADSREQYIDVAAALAADPDKLLFLRRNLRGLCKDHGLGNSARFARNLEIFYHNAVEMCDSKGLESDVPMSDVPMS